MKTRDDGEQQKTEAERLRGFFAEVHAGDTPPAFERLARSGPRQAPAWRWAAVAAVLALAAALAWNVSRNGLPASTEEPLGASELALASSLSQWRAPLDFLLVTPGSKLLSETPRFGGRWPELPSLDGSGVDERSSDEIEREEIL